jgi:hypothetical protein
MGAIALAIGTMPLAGASSPSFTTHSTLPTNSLGGQSDSTFTATFLPNGEALVVDSSTGSLIEMNADGTNQHLFAAVPPTIDGIPTFPYAVSYDASLNLVMAVSEVPTVGSFIDAFTSTGTFVGQVNVTSYLEYVTSMSSAPNGDVLIGGTGGLFDVNVNYTATPTPSLSLNTATQILSTTVDGEAARTIDDILVCTPSNLIEVNGAGVTLNTFSGDANCTDPVLDGGTLFVNVPGNPFLDNQIRSVALSTGTTTVVAGLSATNGLPFPSGIFTSISVMPSNVVNATPGNLFVGENLFQLAQGTANNTNDQALVNMSPTGTGAVTVAIQGGPSVVRFVNATFNPTTGNFYVTDQWGGSVTGVNASTFAQALVVDNYRLPTYSFVSPGRYPIATAVDTVHKYLFVLDANGNVVRFPVTGGNFTAGMTHLTIRQAPNPGGPSGSTGPLLPTAIAVNGSSLYLGYENGVFSESEAGSKPKLILTLHSGDTVNDITAGSDGNFYVTVGGADQEVVVLSAKGKKLRTLGVVAGSTTPIAAAVDNAHHVYIVEASGDLEEVSSNGGKAVSVLKGDGFTGIAINKAGTILLTTNDSIDSTTAKALGQ